MDALLESLTAGRELDAGGIREMCVILFDPEVPVEARARLLEALSAKGETPNEIAGFVGELIGKAVPFPGAGNAGMEAMDVCGTGGDKLGLFNVSTAVMFVVAACGVRVVKHGNRGITSRCGGADVLEALGVRIDLPPDSAAEALERAGCVFLFAQQYHPAFREVAPVRKLLAERGVATVFNKLGPLLNPARPKFQLAGVFAPEMAGVYAEVFRALGRDRAWAVCGEAGKARMDEMSTLGRTSIHEISSDGIRTFHADPAEFGISAPPLDALRGGDATDNARILESILRGESGPAADLVAWNAAGALCAAGEEPGLGDGLGRAREALASGGALARLEALRDFAGRPNP